MSFRGSALVYAGQRGQHGRGRGLSRQHGRGGARQERGRAENQHDAAPRPLDRLLDCSLYRRVLGQPGQRGGMRAATRIDASNEGDPLRPDLGLGGRRLLHRAFGRSPSRPGDSGVVPFVRAYVDNLVLCEGTADRALLQEQLQWRRGAAQPDLHEDKPHPNCSVGESSTWSRPSGRTSSCRRTRPALSARCSVLPALMGVFTAWFQKWYPPPHRPRIAPTSSETR